MPFKTLKRAYWVVNSGAFKPGAGLIHRRACVVNVMGTRKSLVPSEFLATGEEKKNLNWYFYELAHGFKIQLDACSAYPGRDKLVSDDVARRMAIDLSKRLERILVTKNLTTTRALKVDPGWVKHHLPRAPGALVDELVDSLNDTIREQASSCKGCPTQCLKRKNEPCPLFDDPFYSEFDEHDGEYEWNGEYLDEGGWDDEEEYSDELLEKNVAIATEYWKDFTKSKLYSRLPAQQKEHSLSIIGYFADFMYSYNLVPVERWNVYDLEDVCTNIMPRKVTGDPDYFRAISPVLASFFEFMEPGDSGIEDLSGMARRARELAPVIVKRAGDPRAWGMGKSFAMAALDAGFDITKEDELRRAMNAYNSAAITGGSNNPARQARLPGRKKIGRNDPCPCGSGKKFKRCCGSNK